MNDYSLTKEESKTQFVKNYIVKDDHTIEIEFGNGRLYTIQYSENAIRNLNKLMKTEVDEAKKSSLVIRSLTGFVGVAFGAIFASAGLFTTLDLYVYLLLPRSYHYCWHYGRSCFPLLTN